MEENKDKDEIGIESTQQKVEEKSAEKQVKQRKKEGVVKTIPYNDFQIRVAQIFYIAIVAACLVTLGGIVYTIADMIMATGKMELFLGLNFGYQIAIIGGFLAGLFIIIVLFYGLARKGVSNILHNIFRKKIVEDKYKGRLGVKIIAGAFMISIFAIIIGLMIAIFYDIFIGIEDPASSIYATLSSFSQGQVVLSIGIIMFVFIILSFLLNYLWYNGYYVILNIVSDLSGKDEEL